jgi:hypothetical protein
LLLFPSDPEALKPDRAFETLLSNLNLIQPSGFETENLASV